MRPIRSKEESSETQLQQETYLDQASSSYFDLIDLISALMHYELQDFFF